jgi:2-keto-4-pentenoate hydratase/2-oxohepta-3-ene-1,7-dioic acid hydratase in catechol pathway
MRIANVAGRLALLTGDTAVDVEKASGGEFGPDPQSVYERWEAFTAWAAAAALPAGDPFKQSDLGSPAPAPRQVLAIGLNYRAHAAESGYAVPAGEPPVFTKFSSCIIGPRGDITLALVSKLSATMPLLPGDVIFTGTPSGVGLGRDPQRWLADGEELVSHIEGIGELRHRFIAPKEA